MKNFTVLFLLVVCFNAALFFSFDTAHTLSVLGETPGKIEFIGDAGSPNKMTFEKWAFTEAAMPNDEVEQLHLLAEIDIASINGDWKDLVNSIRKKKDYFNASKFPRATVEVNGAVLQEDGTYQTDALLTLKKFTKPVRLNFTISEEKPFVVKGKGEISRKAFGFTGGGPKEIVPITFEASLPFE